jgi:hypothetical protein
MRIRAKKNMPQTCGKKDKSASNLTTPSFRDQLTF